MHKCPGKQKYTVSISPGALSVQEWSLRSPEYAYSALCFHPFPVPLRWYRSAFSSSSSFFHRAKINTAFSQLDFFPHTRSPNKVLTYPSAAGHGWNNNKKLNTALTYEHSDIQRLYFWPQVCVVWAAYCHLSSWNSTSALYKICFCTAEELTCSCPDWRCRAERQDLSQLSTPHVCETLRMKYCS